MPVAQLAAHQKSLQTFDFLRMVAPRMMAAEFTKRIASAFFLWPKELLEPNIAIDTQSHINTSEPRS